jgi:hypothetical protein
MKLRSPGSYTAFLARLALKVCFGSLMSASLNRGKSPRA